MNGHALLATFRIVLVYDVSILRSIEKRKKNMLLLQQLWCTGFLIREYLSKRLLLISGCLSAAFSEVLPGLILYFPSL